MILVKMFIHCLVAEDVIIGEDLRSCFLGNLYHETGK